MKAVRLGRLEVQIEGDRVTMRGRIDDSVVFAELLPHLPPGDVVIDTGGVTFMNSIGMREWGRLLRALRERGSAVTLERVADVLITQLNVLRDPAVSVTIKSFQAQYVCPRCGAEHVLLVEVAPHAQALRRLEPPRMPCPECSGSMELGDFPERYLTIFKG